MMMEYLVIRIFDPFFSGVQGGALAAVKILAEVLFGPI